jgi:hypothetical protein
VIRGIAAQQGFMLFFEYINLRRHPDSNWGMRVLQTLALPLGYAADRAVARLGFDLV